MLCKVNRLLQHIILLPELAETSFFGAILNGDVDLEEYICFWFYPKLFVLKFPVLRMRRMHRNEHKKDYH